MLYIKYRSTRELLKESSRYAIRASCHSIISINRCSLVGALLLVGMVLYRAVPSRDGVVASDCVWSLESPQIGINWQIGSVGWLN